MESLVLIGLTLVGFILLGMRPWAPAKSVRVIYLPPVAERRNYIRFKPNPGFTWSNTHFCFARRGKCPYRKAGKAQKANKPNPVPVPKPSGMRLDDRGPVHSRHERVS